MKKYITIFAVVGICAVGVFMLATRSTDAQVPTPTLIPTLTPTPLPSPSPSFSPLTGWAWSSNIGWISFNSSNTGGGATYGVQVDLNTGRMSGYAWSSNIGWIQFGGLNHTPVNSGNAMVNLTSGAVTGWARACGGTVSSTDVKNNNQNSPTMPGDCSTISGNMTSRPDGWDGWIELSGTNHQTGDTSGANGTSQKGVTYKTVTTGTVTAGTFTGYAWGGPVVGWINFDPNIGYSGQGGVPPTNCPGCGGGPTNPVVQCLTPATLVNLSPSGGTVSVSASASGGSGTGYTYAWGIDGVFGSYGANPSTVTLPQNSQLTPQTHTISVMTKDSAGNTSTGAATCNGQVTVAPPVVGNTLQLLIGAYPGTSLIVTSATTPPPLRVKLGSAFQLSWTNTLTPFNPVDNSGYKCTPSLPANGPVNWLSSNFNNSTYVSPGSATTNAQNIDTSLASTGLYTFTINCTSSVNIPAATSTTAVLHVVSVSEGER
jgi:hypothetical protein